MHVCVGYSVCTYVYTHDFNCNTDIITIIIVSSSSKLLFFYSFCSIHQQFLPSHYIAVSLIGDPKTIFINYIN